MRGTRSTVGGAALAVLAIVMSAALNAGWAEAAFPGKNGKIAFDGVRAYSGGTYSGIWSVTPSGSVEGGLNIGSLFDTSGAPYDAAWSPNGRRIAYVDIFRSSSSIFTMSAKGEKRRRLTGTDAYDPAWSPSGKSIVFTRGYDFKTSEIFKIRANGSRKVRLTKNKVEDYEPVWSRRGRIAYVREPKRKEGNSDLYTMKANGGGGKRLTKTEDEYEYRPDWSPNGRKIVFGSTASAGDVLGISMVKANGGGRYRLTELYGEEPAWSPNGKKIVFAWGNIYTAPVPSRKQGPIAPGVPFQVTKEPGQYSDHGPDWQPR